MKCRIFTTKDQSEIRELLGVSQLCDFVPSIAGPKARVMPELTTTLHYHVKCEEIYYVLRMDGQDAGSKTSGVM